MHVYLSLCDKLLFIKFSWPFCDFSLLNPFGATALVGMVKKKQLDELLVKNYENY